MYIYIYVKYIYIYIPVRTLLVYFRNRHVKIFLHVSLWCPLLITDHIFGKKLSLKALRQVLIKLFPAACIQLDNYDLFENAWVKLSPLIQNSVQNDYFRESYARYLPSYQKFQKSFAPFMCGLFSTVPLNLYGKHWGWGKILPNSKKFTHFPHQKNPL